MQPSFKFCRENRLPNNKVHDCMFIKAFYSTFKFIFKHTYDFLVLYTFMFRQVEKS